jgi:hypothetical protein
MGEREHPAEDDERRRRAGRLHKAEPVSFTISAPLAGCSRP